MPFISVTYSPGLCKVCRWSDVRLHPGQDHIRAHALAHVLARLGENQYAVSHIPQHCGFHSECQSARLPGPRVLLAPMSCKPATEGSPRSATSHNLSVLFALSGMQATTVTFPVFGFTYLCGHLPAGYVVLCIPIGRYVIVASRRF